MKEIEYQTAKTLCVLLWISLALLLFSMFLASFDPLLFSFLALLLILNLILALTLTSRLHACRNKR